MAKEMGESKSPSMGSIERMEIRPAENGGHVVTHHMKAKMSRDSKAHSGMSMGYPEPEMHVFGKEESHKMLKHIAAHLNLKEMAKEESGGAGEQEHEEPEEDE
jgi:hypothetical protein